MGAKAFFKCHFFILVWTIIDVLVDIYPFIILVNISLFSKTFTAVVTRDAKIPGSLQSFTPGIFWKFQSRDFLVPG